MNQKYKNCVVIVLTILLSGVLPDSVLAEDRLDFELTRHGKFIKSAFKGVVAQSKHVVVEVEINRLKTCPGTLINTLQEGQSGLIVCKASLLGKSVSEEDQFRSRGVDEVWRSAEFLGYDRELDLNFLIVDLSDVQKKREIHHAKNTKPGQWLISLEYQKELPLGVGVLGAEPRGTSSSKGYVGLKVDETKQGLSVTKVMANSGAANAGFLTGDQLMESEEKMAKKRRWFSKTLRQYEPGDWMSLLAKRGEEVLTFNLQIGAPWDSVLNRQAMMNRFGSDLSQRRSGFRSVIQHDIILHPKFCGGPIVNLRGEIVGVNIARAGRTDTLAVPIAEIVETAKKFERE